MALAKNKIDFYEQMSEKIFQIVPKESFSKQLKPLILTGYFTGLLPIQNTLNYKSSSALQNKKLSLIYVCSFILLVFKLNVVWEGYKLLAAYNARGQRSETKHLEMDTDQFAGILGFSTTFCFGIAAHILAICRLSKFLETLQKIEAYDERYNYVEEETDHGVRKMCRTKKSKSGIITTILITYTPVYLLYLIVPILVDDPGYNFRVQILPFVYTENPILGSIYINIGFFLLEVGVTFVYFQVFQIVGALSRRLIAIRRIVEQKLPHALENEDMFLKRPKIDMGNCNRSWDEISEQYMDYRSILSTFQQFSSLYFSIMYLTLIVSTVCMTYYGSSNTEVVKACGSGLQVVVWISFGRIVSLADCGYLIETEYSALVKSTMRVYQTAQFGDTDKRQFRKFLKLLTGTKLSLVSGGFFTVNRRNFTSITSVIITYTIVLFQFHISDKEVTSGAGTTTTSLPISSVTTAMSF